MVEKNIELLDCTIRDGGYVNDWNFTDEQIRECYIACSKSNVDYMEIGFRNFGKMKLLNKYGPTFFCDEEYINNTIGDLSGCKLAVMVTINAFDINDFVPKSQSKISMVRVLMAYHGSKNKDDSILDVSQLMDGINQINMLIELGYEVSFNIGRIDKMDKSQLYEVCKLLSQTKIKYFTMADTYGSIDLDNIEKLIPYIKFLFEDLFHSNIKIGFHAHDNMSNGTCKALQSIKYGASIIDGCILGYGRGSGNAKTELIMMDLNKNYNKNYDFINMIEYGDNHIIHYKECNNNLCYNVVYALSSYFGCHVTYAIDIIENYDKMQIRDIYNTFKKLKELKKHMFYWEDLFMKIHNESK
uniref:Pyruvate carboxyltransferase domain-containing protein n=1 Tax=viral metagenome TaxID=1070528 RepID=A0A6C0EVD6_9ZZZZ